MTKCKQYYFIQLNKEKRNITIEIAEEKKDN